MKKLSLLALLLAAFAPLSACDLFEEVAEQTIQGEAAPLAEADMPNCSRVINCCSKLKTYSFTPQEVLDACDDQLSPASDTLIQSYQDLRDGIEADTTLDASTKADLLAELQLNYQNKVEPGCRCFLEETVGAVSFDGVLSPLDCEIVEDVGALTPPATCSDATDLLIEFASDPGAVTE